MSRLVSASRFVIILAVIDSFVLATILLVYSTVESVRIALSLIGGAGLSKQDPKAIALAAIKTVDLLLLGTVFYIIALGLYELFIDEHVPVPRWLEIRSFDDLKHALIGVLVVVMSVLFLEYLMASERVENMLYLGLPIALVIAALAYFQSHSRKESKREDE
jgi:uncharacterized membrane protein YqhA